MINETTALSNSSSFHIKRSVKAYFFFLSILNESIGSNMKHTKLTKVKKLRKPI